MERIKLFCLPYAGGSATIFKKWNQNLNKQIELIPLELAGRGARIQEPFYETVFDSVNDIYNKICDRINDSPYAFYGHSMGSVILYELCHLIMEKGSKEPIHVFVSGRNPPHINMDKEKLHRLPNENFKERILDLGGTPKTLFDNKELSKIFVPILKADYKMIEEYEYIERNRIFKCGITVFNGKADTDIVYGNLLEWKKYTMSSCRIFEFEGGHFFINNYSKEITDIINQTLLNYI